MFCVYCGQQLPDDASFCKRCGARQQAGNQAEVAEVNPAVIEGPIWETCRISAEERPPSLRAALTGGAERTFQFWASAMGPSGPYRAESSSEFDTTHDAPQGQEAEEAYKELADTLVKDGWEPVGNVGVARYEYEFRREVRGAAPSGGTSTTTNFDAASVPVQTEVAEAGATVQFQPGGSYLPSVAVSAQQPISQQAPPRPEPQPSGCISFLYFITVGWWMGLLWLELGVFMLFTLAGVPLSLAFWRTVWTMASLRRGSEPIGQIFSKQWNVGKSWYGEIPLIPKIVPYWLAFFLIIGAWMVFSQMYTPRSNYTYAERSTSSDGREIAGSTPTAVTLAAVVGSSPLPLASPRLSPTAEMYLQTPTIAAQYIVVTATPEPSNTPARPTPQVPTAALPPPTPTEVVTRAPSYDEIMANYDKMTSSQWEKYKSDLKGQSVDKWQGSVNEVSKHLLGGKHGVSVALGGCDSMADVKFDLPAEEALKLDKCARIEFSGTIKGIDCGLGILHHCTVNLSDVTVEVARRQ